MFAEGPTRKLLNALKSPVQVYAEVGEHVLHLNSLIGKSLFLKSTGIAVCKSCLKKFEDLFRMGCCKKCFFESQLAGDSILRPELSTAHLGIEDRNLEHEKLFQLQPHVVYLAEAGHIKVGVTRLDQINNRWMDQGARRAIVIAQTSNRFEAGLIEVELKRFYSDKTNWRKMLSNEIDGRDLEKEAIKSQDFFPDHLRKYFKSNGKEQEILFDCSFFDKKISSVILKGKSEIEGELFGLRGQYLLFADGRVINIRSHEGQILFWKY